MSAPLRWRVPRVRGSEGFAIPVAALVIIVVSMLALGGLYVAVSNLKANAAIHRSWKALYAADAGAKRVVATWDRTAYGALTPGDSADTGWRTLPDGSQYRTVVLRVDAGAGSGSLYRLKTIGRPALGATAQRVILTLVQATAPSSICCRAGVRLQGRLRVRDPGVKVSGADTPPPLWGAQCPAPGPAGPGVSIPNPSDVTYQGGATIAGSPAVEQDTSISSSTFSNFGDLTYAELAAMADKQFLGNQTFAGTIFPQVSGGQCVQSAPTNWGDPLNPASPCWGYLPIIHVAGRLTISGAGYGQGILLVDDDLNVTGSFQFYGVAIVLGKADWESTSLLTGGIMVRNDVSGSKQSQVRDNAKLQYSSCAVSRALAKLSMVKPLAGRHWFEVLQ